MITVLGKDVTLYVYRSGSPALTVCATNLSRRESVETLNITTIDSGRANEYVGGSTDSEVTLSGVRTLANVSDWQIDDFEIGNTERIIIIYLDSAGNSVSYDGNVLITGVEDDNGAADFSTYTVTMLRSGAWTKLYNVVVGDLHYLVDGNGDYILDSNGDYIIVP
jgi:predicted secreted protein